MTCASRYIFLHCRDNAAKCCGLQDTKERLRKGDIRTREAKTTRDEMSRRQESAKTSREKMIPHSQNKVKKTPPATGIYK
jgi:hypothetical protein